MKTQLRRSSSSDTLSLLGRQSGPPARSSSISRPSSIARPSIIGRQSLAQNTKAGNTEFTVSTQEMIRSIADILDKGEFVKKYTQFTTKNLQPASASASTFYAIFEFLLNEMGVDEVWNPDLLFQNPQNRAGGAAGTGSSSQSSSQQSQQQANNPAAQNKLRIDLVIFHLNTLKFNNVPKPSVFQTMTSSNNWTKMLQILYALCNDIKYLQIYTEKKLMYSENTLKPRECINEFVAKIYLPLSRDEGFRSTDEYLRLQKEALEKYEKNYKHGLNKQELEAERENLRKTYEHLYANRNELENLAQEEQALVNSIQDDQTKLAKEAQELEERRQRIHIKKKELARLKEKVNQVEEEAAAKEALYDQQLAKNPDRSNIQMVHGQKLQELDKLQKQHFELDEVKDQLDCQLAKVTEQAKKVIQKVNEQVNLIHRTTQVSGVTDIPDFPHVNLVDVHRPSNYLEEYTKTFHKIRTKFNAETQKLPFEIYKVEEEKKQIERRIDANEVKIQQLKETIKQHDAHLTLLGKKKEEAFKERETSLNDLKRLFLESEAQLKGRQQEVDLLKSEFDQEKEQSLSMAHELQAQLEAEHKQFEELKQTSVLEFEEKKAKLLNHMQKDMALMRELKKSQEKDMGLLKSYIESCRKKHNY